VLLKALVGWVRLLLVDGPSEQAVLVWGLIDQHPVMTAQLRQVHLQPLMSLVDVSAYPNEFALGKHFDLNALVDQILKDELSNLA